MRTPIAEHPSPSLLRKLAIPLLASMAMAAGLLGGLAFLSACSGKGDERHVDGRIILNYWDKWTGREAQAMRDLVDAYNTSQKRVFIRFISASGIEQKLLLATAGGNPPDIAGMYSKNVVSYAEKGVLVPLDRLMKRDGISREDYLASILACCEHRGFMWGLPTTPSTLALHYNTRHFREAGLDPAKPPRTMAELDEVAEKLTIRNPDGTFRRMGFLPSDPGWWNTIWGYWFGASLTTPDGARPVPDTPENIAAYKWIQGYIQRYGRDRINRFSSANGQFASAENSFISGRMSMQMQGIWMSGFIKEFSTDLEWAAAPFPTANETITDATMIEVDVLAIPRGVRHEEESWKFIKYVQEQKNMEKLCLGQGKFPPLTKVSPEFYASHPNPYVHLFRRLAESPNAKPVPRIPNWDEYNDELGNMFDRVWGQDWDPALALKKVRERLEPKFERQQRLWKKIEAARREEWSHL